MEDQGLSIHPDSFANDLYPLLQRINPGIGDLEPYEFQYCLDNVTPEKGWDSVTPAAWADIERMIAARGFYESIQLKPRIGGSIVIDKTILNLTHTLFTGLVRGAYSEDWIRSHFYFDIRAFVFFCRTVLFTEEVKAHFGGAPYLQFEPQQNRFERFQEIGYKDFKAANREVDAAFIESLLKLVRLKGTPILLTIAGPTAAGKTEIGERLMRAFGDEGLRIAVIEMDNFLFDRELREGKQMGRETTFVDLFIASMEDLLKGKPTSIPHYDSVGAKSSHDENGSLRPGSQPLKVEPADIIFVEGNFPFHMQETAGLIGIKTAYLTGDPIRLKRKWLRDVDCRKKYDPNYLVNRFFATQFLRLQDTYLPQLIACDLAVDTTNAVLWAAPEIAELLERA